MTNSIRRYATIALVSIGALSATHAAAQTVPGEVRKPQNDENVILVSDCGGIDQKEQLVLERRALGGDLQAQYYVAACSWPLKNKVIENKKHPKHPDNLPDEAEAGDGAENSIFAFKLFGLKDINEQESKPEGERSSEYKLFKRRVFYAYQWSTLAYCDRQFNDLADQMEALENDDHIYRRKIPNPDFRRLEDRQNELEESHLNFIRRSANDYLYLMGPDGNSDASKAFVAQMRGLGASGLATLGLMRDCPSFPGVDQRFARVAIWEGAKSAFEQSFSFEQATKPDEAAAAGEESFLEERAKFWSEGVTSEDKRFVDAFRLSYGLGAIQRRRPTTSAEEAALGRMGDVPVQYLQLALGAFRRVPTFYPQGLSVPQFTVDNIYGKDTSMLAKQAQASYCVIRDVAAAEGALTNVLDPKVVDPGERDVQCIRTKGKKTDPQSELRRREAVAAGTSKDYPTAWLTSKQSRALICRAATMRGDPYSYMHLAQMFANGEGYPQDLDRALYAAKEAQRLFDRGAPDRTSNFNDLKGKKITDVYKKRAKELEENIYKVVGAEISGGAPLDEATIRRRIDDRIEVERYYEENNLCPDQAWKYWQKKRQARGEPPRGESEPENEKKAGADDSEGGVDANGATITFWRGFDAELTQNIGVGGDEIILNDAPVVAPQVQTDN